jgi:hypothetical protein
MSAAHPLAPLTGLTGELAATPGTRNLPPPYVAATSAPRRNSPSTSCFRTSGPSASRSRRSGPLLGPVMPSAPAGSTQTVPTQRRAQCDGQLYCMLNT